jgi:hypothetical protein
MTVDDALLIEARAIIAYSEHYHSTIDLERDLCRLTTRVSNCVVHCLLKNEKNFAANFSADLYVVLFIGRFET